MLIPREDLPDDAAEWSEVVVEFPRLPDDSLRESPFSEDDVFEHVQTESADVDEAERSRLKFLRSASVGDCRYWLWSYTGSDGERDFIAVRLDLDGTAQIGLASPNGLSEEQFLMADYYDEVYWS